MAKWTWIHLGKGFQTIVDWSDYLALRKYDWQLNKRGNYCRAYRVKYESGKRHTIYLHREIMRAKPGAEVDHINGNSLDNRRSNLRIATRSQNSVNRSKKPNCTSRYIGVCWDKLRKQWKVTICKDYKRVFMEFFSDERHAAMAYDIWVKDFHGEYAKLNFG